MVGDSLKDHTLTKGIIIIFLNTSNIKFIPFAFNSIYLKHTGGKPNISCNRFVEYSPIN